MFRVINVLLILTLIQFWWIAIWGLAYIIIDYVAGSSKIKQSYIYGSMLIFTVIVLFMNPKMIDRF